MFALKKIASENCLSNLETFFKARVTTNVSFYTVVNKLTSQFCQTTNPNKCYTLRD